MFFAILLRIPFIAGGRRSSGTFLRLLHHEPISKPFPTTPSSPNSDLAASFFKTSCNLSPSAALAAAATFNTKSTANAESVLRLLQSYGFPKSNIALIATRNPLLFSFHLEKCIKPKLDLFIAEGFTGNFIVNLFTKNPNLLKVSLERRLSPNLHLLMTTFGGDRKNVATSISRGTWILGFDLKKNMLPNIETLREHGVAGANIAMLIRLWPGAITAEPDRFNKAVAPRHGIRSFIYIVHSRNPSVHWTRPADMGEEAAAFPQFRLVSGGDSIRFQEEPCVHGLL